VAVDQVIAGFVGTSGSGKTTLIERLIPELASRGLTVGLIKHTSRHFEVDYPGKDTYRFKQAGAAKVLISSAERLALISDLAERPSLAELARRHFSGCDVVLVEGHKGAGVPKIVVEREGAPRGLIDPKGLSSVCAVVSDLARDRFPGARRYAFGDISGLADFIARGMPRLSGSVAGVVLAGGLSTRLGEDKTELSIGAETLLERSAGLLASVCREVWIIGRKAPESLEGLGVRWHLDMVPRSGPMGGLYTALKVADASRCLAIACDMPRLTEDVLRRLINSPADGPVVAAKGPGGRLEPLCAIYSKDLLPKAKELLGSGRFKLSGLMGPETRLVDFSDPEHLFFNINTPEELAKLTG
jgi:molybdopterin-guanine dinucleotide biosynthesis protein B